jgi:hypothetical protein
MKYTWFAVLCVIILGGCGGYMLWNRPKSLEVPDNGAPASAITESRSRRDKMARIQAEPASSINEDVRNQRVSIHAKVLDEKENPISAATVAYEVRHWNLVREQLPTIYPTFKVVSDSDGRVSLSEGSGDVVTIISVEKSGYFMDEGALRAYKIGDSLNASFLASSNIVLHMFSSSGRPREVFKRDFTKRLASAKETHRVPLLDESGLTFGTLVIFLDRIGEIDLQHKNDWNYTLSLDSGSILEETNRISSMKIVPSAGFTTQFCRAITKTNWTSLDTHRFYLKPSGSSRWATLAIDVHARSHGDYATVDFEYHIFEPGGE